MKKTDRNALIAFPVVVLIGAGVAVAGSQGGATVFGIPVFALAVALAFLIQWLAFIPAYLLQNEGFFDLTGSVTYITVTHRRGAAQPGGGRPVVPAAGAGRSSGRRAWAPTCSVASARPARTPASTPSSRRSSASSTPGPCRGSG